VTRDEQKALLVAFAEWYGQAYAANFIPRGTIDAFLAARQPPGEQMCPDCGRVGGHLCTIMPPPVAACAPPAPVKERP
jgi:hypothetical protein